jgi:putative NADPH-quinone reductase
MRVSIILAHPDPRSFNHAIAQAALAKLVQHKHQVILHDLYAEKFDPILLTDEIPKGVFVPPEVDAHCQEISQAEGIIIIHPNWWGQPPAILKGWLDRVIRRRAINLEGDREVFQPACWPGRIDLQHIKHTHRTRSASLW